MAFNPQQHMTKIQGRDYLEVKWRIVWFRESNPNGLIDTDVTLIGDTALVKATVYDNERNHIASGMATIRAAEGREQRSWGGREIEKAETAAIGRALAVAGYGTQFTGDEMDEGQYLSDAPVQRQQKPKQQPSNVTDLPQLEDGQEGYAQATTQVQVLSTKGDSFRYVIGGAAMFTPSPLEELFSDHPNIAGKLSVIGDVTLPDDVSVVYVQSGKWQNIARIRRNSTGEVYDLSKKSITNKAS